jgi:hypothetical protein
MALDEAPKYPRAALPGARGGRTRDQEDPDNVRIVASPAQAAHTKLLQFLTDKLNPDDINTVGELLGELLGATDPDSVGNPALAGDRRPGLAYEQRFPHQGRLVRTF